MPARARTAGSFAVIIETGAKRAFASAAEWPGWARSGRDEAAALEALVAYAPRYAQAIARAKAAFSGAIRRVGSARRRTGQRQRDDRFRRAGCPGKVRREAPERGRARAASARSSPRDGTRSTRASTLRAGGRCAKVHVAAAARSTRSSSTSGALRPAICRPSGGPSRRTRAVGSSSSARAPRSSMGSPRRRTARSRGRDRAEVCAGGRATSRAVCSGTRSITSGRSRTAPPKRRPSRARAPHRVDPCRAPRN